MPQTLVISTPDAVSTTTKTFPKQGVYNLKITRNGEFDTVELWFRSAAANITLELAGASFLSTAQVSAPRIAPTAPTSISGSTLALTPNATHYMKIKLNNGISVAHLRCSYTAKSANATVAGGNIRGQAFVDYSKKPYISTSLERMFTTYPVKTDLTKWDIPSVTSLADMFLDNITFNQPIGNWNVSNVTAMNGMFSRATAFNQPIGNWNVSNVTSMGGMFQDAAAFNQDLSSWNVSNVTNFLSMFKYAKSFNKPVSNWNMSKATSINGIFYGATLFDQDVNTWNLSNCTSFGSVFRETSFNRPLSNWDVSKGTEFGGMFWLNLKFNQPLSMWNVSSAVNMVSMFQQAIAFNQDISNWNISKVTDMGNMFNGATAYNQDLSPWCAKFNINVNLANFLDNSGMSVANYSAFLNALWADIGTTRQGAWVTRTVAKILGAANLKYNSTASAARASLIANGWTITDGGLAQ